MNNPTWLDKTLNWLLIDVSSQIIRENEMSSIRIMESCIVLVEYVTEAYIKKTASLTFYASNFSTCVAIAQVKEISEDYDMACGFSFRTGLAGSVKSAILTKIVNSKLQSVTYRL